MIGVAVVGCGYWGPNLVRNFARHPGSELRAVCDSRIERAQRIAAEYRVPVATARLEDVLSQADVSLVAVATPSFTHFEVARAALMAGKHVLVMKPLTTRVDHAEELCHLALKQGVLLAVDHTFVFTAAVRRMRDLISQGEIGDLFYFDSVRINLGLIQTDINVLWDLAPHDVSIMDYLVGQEPTSVSAIGAAHGGSPRENIAYLTVSYGGALLGHVHVNWLAPAKVRRTIVGGSRKMMIYDDMEPSEKLRVYDKGVSISPNPSPENNYEILISYRTGDMYAPQLDPREALAVETDNIVKAVEGRERLEVDGQAGLRVVRILETAQRSIDAGGKPVAMNGGRTRV